jgi:gliding motility-associated-like protein
MTGDTTLYSPGYYGVQGMPSIDNTPQALFYGNGWADLQGNLWLYGGLKGSTGQQLSDLWKYDVVSNLWTWVKGPGTVNQAPVRGTKGVPNINNTPGARSRGFFTWTDLNGDLWLFGGAHTGPWALNDLWRYHIPTNEWTWMSGSTIWTDPGHYGTILIPDSLNCPPVRKNGSCSWVDNMGNLWLFGGKGYMVHYNDLWKYDIVTNEWSWMHGSNIGNQLGIYGTQNVPDPANTPGAREVYAHWKDSDGNFWLFGGWGDIGYYNDLWKFDVQSLQWTWVSGPNSTNQPTVDTGQCLPSVNSIPAGREAGPMCWIGKCDMMFLYGGNTATFPVSTWGDLWCFNRFTNQWTFVDGSLTPNIKGEFGTKGTPGPLNHPPALYNSYAWTDQNRNLWLFGGSESISPPANTYNTLWRYFPDTICPQSSFFNNITLTHDTTICSGDSIQLLASGGLSYMWTPICNISNPQVSNPIVFPDTTTTYQVQITNACGQHTFPVRITINSDSSFVLQSSDTTICSSDSIILQATGGTNYIWFPSTGLSDTSISNPVAHPASTTTYSVIISNDCYAKTFQIKIAVIPDSVKRIVNNDTVICEGQEIILQALGGIFYHWNTGDTGSTVSLNPAFSNIYTVTMTDFDGCVGVDSVYIDVNPNPFVSVSPSETTICNGDTIVLQADGAVNYFWNPSSYLSGTVGKIIKAFPNKEVLIFVTGIDNNGCTDSTSVEIVVEECLVTIPNVFTPNGDGKNDTFFVDYKGSAEVKVVIYNRWGKVLFEGNEAFTPWDGTFHGRTEPDGTYFYHIEIGGTNYIGTITIIRN